MSLFSPYQEIMIETADLTDVRDVDGDEAVSRTCPFCHTNRNKFYFNRKGMYICFLCGEKGNFYQFLNHYANLSRKEVNKLLQEKNVDSTSEMINSINDNSELDSFFAKVVALLKTPELQYNDKEYTHEHLKMPPLPTNTITINEALHNRMLYEPVFNYLKKRKVKEEWFNKYDIRVALNSKCQLKNNRTLSLGNSLVFVTYNDLGEPIYWNTRSLSNNSYLKTYNASPLSKDYYSKSNVVFNLNRAFRNSNIVICESVLNAMMVDNTFSDLIGVATFGKVITDKQIHQILLKQPERIYIALDPDAMSESLSLIKRIQKVNPAQKIYLVQYNNHIEDLNDLGTYKSIMLLKNAQDVSKLNLLQLELKVNLNNNSQYA